MKRIDKGPPCVASAHKAVINPREVAGSRRDAGLWRRPLCWKVKPPGPWPRPPGVLCPSCLVQPPPCTPTPRIHLPCPCAHVLFTHPFTRAAVSQGQASCRSRLWAPWFLTPGCREALGLRPGASRSVLGSGLPQGLRRGHQHSGAALEPRWGLSWTWTSLLALQAM